MTDAPVFDEAFRDDLKRLIAWRRDVRRFSDRPVANELIEQLLDIADLAPSVGNSQPWRWVRVDSPDKRRDIRAAFLHANEEAQHALPEDLAVPYGRLKLEGLDRAPVQFAVFCDHGTDQGHGLGRKTMPETLDYSTAAMIATFWLAARAAGIGVGWVSILEPDRVCATLDVPPSWKLIAYLCVGWPDELHLDPELERSGWQHRTGAGRVVRVV
jgi:5,6-dimethylbenzimidazole synthase